MYTWSTLRSKLAKDIPQSLNKTSWDEVLFMLTPHLHGVATLKDAEQPHSCAHETEPSNTFAWLWKIAGPQLLRRLLVPHHHFVSQLRVLAASLPISWAISELYCSERCLPALCCSPAAMQHPAGCLLAAVQDLNICVPLSSESAALPLIPAISRKAWKWKISPKLVLKHGHNPPQCLWFKQSLTTASAAETLKIGW